MTQAKELLGEFLKESENNSSEAFDAVIRAILEQMELDDWEEYANILHKKADEVQTQNANWRTGGHGHECKCRHCKDIFDNAVKRCDGYQELLTRWMTRKTCMRREENNYRLYDEQPMITERMMKQSMEDHRKAMEKLRKWIKDNNLYRLKSPVHIFPDSGIPEINCVIVDASGIYTRAQSAEYYMSLKGAHPNKGGKSQKQILTPCDETLAKTLVIDTEGIDLLARDDDNKLMQGKLMETIAVLSFKYSESVERPLKVYFIYGEKEFREKGNAATIHRIYKELIMYSIFNVTTIWLGPGVGWYEMDYDGEELEHYRNRTNEMAKQSLEKWDSNVKGYNIFVNQKRWKNTYKSKEERNAQIRKDLKTYIVTGDPSYLPEWVLEQRVMLPKGQSKYRIRRNRANRRLTGGLKCSACKQQGHDFFKCPNRPRICCSCGQEGHNFYTCPTGRT
jgi:hypothetical protein